MGNKGEDTRADALSDAREVLNRIDDARLIELVERWSSLSESVKDEIWQLVEHDQNDQILDERSAE